ncbi:MAG: c-type cytochrome, partial [Campylobacteraceae bacterium]
ISFCLVSTNAADSKSIENGEKQYKYWCATCHDAGKPGANALGIVYSGTGISEIIDKRDDLEYETVKFFIRNGKHSMPFFRKTELSDKDIEDISNYIKENSKKK